MSLSRVFTWAAVAFTLWWTIRQPASAAHLIFGIGHVARSAAHGLSDFVAGI